MVPALYLYINIFYKSVAADLQVKTKNAQGAYSKENSEIVSS